MQKIKNRLIDVFTDTQKFYTSNEDLVKAISTSKSSTKFYASDEYPELPDVNEDNIASVAITNSRTFGAAARLCIDNPDKKIGVLNFASATEPCSGLKKGRIAQEESLCRCSTLYPILNQHYLWQKYYNANRGSRNPLYTDACIYSPDITICKTDEEFPKRLLPENWCNVDVITCSAPNLRRNFSDGDVRNNDFSISAEQLLEIHIKRGRHILTIACANGVDIIVLGAFGCGGFANNPRVVASAYQQLVEEFRSRFVKIEFAIYCRGRESLNYKAFKEIIK